MKTYLISLLKSHYPENKLWKKNLMELIDLSKEHLVGKCDLCGNVVKRNELKAIEFEFPENWHNVCGICYASVLKQG